MGLLDYFMGGSNGIVDPAMAAKASASGGLLDFLSPTDSDKTAALKRGLLAAGFGILGAKTGGNALAALGQGGAQGVGAYDDMLQQQKQQKLTGYNMQRQQKQDDRQAHFDAQADTSFNNQQEVFQQGQQKQQALQALASKYRDTKTGAFDTQGYVNELYQYDPKEALDYQEKMNLAKERSNQMQFQRELSNKAQFGGQEIMKDDAGNIFFATTIRDPKTQQIIPNLVAADGSGIKPQGRIKIANNPYGLTDSEKVTQVRDEAGAKHDADTISGAKTSVRDFSSTMQQIARAKDLLPKATNSGYGAMRDNALGFFGGSTDAGTAAAELETIGGWLTSGVPRMQGPQSDKDVEQYRIMAGNVANSKLPVKYRQAQLAALEEFLIQKNTKQQEVLNTNNGTPQQAPFGQQKGAEFGGTAGSAPLSRQKAGGVLHVDANGNKAMVYPDGSYDEVN